MLAQTQLMLHTVRLRGVKLLNHLMKLGKINMLNSGKFILQSVHAVAQILQRDELLQVYPQLLLLFVFFCLQLELDCLYLALMVNELVAGHVGKVGLQVVRC